MKMYSDIEALPATPIEPVATMGNFDGVHRGHQAILARVKQEAERIGAETMVITFHPHPRQVLRPEAPFHSIMSLRERMRRLWDLDIDHALVIPFNADTVDMTAREFCEDVLWDALKVQAMYVGRDTHFGKDRGGDVRYLASEGRRLGFHTGIVEPIFAGDRPISSSRIRAAILAGDLGEAARLLGRQHRAVGKVVEGDKRGRELGFPTANLETDGAMLPPNGVYAAWAHTEHGDKRHPAVVNIGVRPTFANPDAPATPRVEAHLLGFEGDLYGQPLAVDFVDRIRPETRFETAQLLKRQIKRDAQEAKRILEH